MFIKQTLKCFNKFFCVGRGKKKMEDMVNTKIKTERANKEKIIDIFTYLEKIRQLYLVHIESYN